MFDVADRAIAWIPVSWPGISQPSEDGAIATSVEHQVEILVEIHDTETLKGVFPHAFGNGEETEKLLFTIEDFRKLASNWRKVVANKIPLEFIDENILKVMRVPGFTAAFQTAYLNAAAGFVETRKGN